MTCSLSSCNQLKQVKPDSNLNNEMKALHVWWCVISFPPVYKDIYIYTPHLIPPKYYGFSDQSCGVTARQSVTYLLPGLDCSADCLTARQLQQKYSFCHQKQFTSSVIRVSNDYIQWMLFILNTHKLILPGIFPFFTKISVKNPLCSNV